MITGQESVWWGRSATKIKGWPELAQYQQPQPGKQTNKHSNQNRYIYMHGWVHLLKIYIIVTYSNICVEKPIWGQIYLLNNFILCF